MWDKLLYRLRGHAPDVGGGLGSWRLSIVLMVSAALYYVLLAVFAFLSPSHVVRNIASLAPFWLLYALLLANTVACLWGRLGALRREMSSRPTFNRGTPEWQRPTDAGVGPEEAGALLRGLGYRPRVTGDGQLWAMRRGWAALGTFLFHGAFLLVAAGFLVSLLTRAEARVRVAAGEEFSGRPDQFLSSSPPRVLSAGLPTGSFRTARIDAEFWRDQLLFTRLGAELVVGSGRAVTTRINDPVWWDWCSFLRLSGYGYAPRYEIVDRGGLVLDSAFVKLDVFPPGRRDFFKAAHYPHRFYVEVLPDHAEVDGEALTRSLNLVRPAVVLRVLRGKVDLGGATLPLGQGFAFEGLTLRFPEIRYWGEFAIVRDPGLPVLFAGYVVGMVGLLLGLGGRRREVEWRRLPEGRGVLCGWGDAEPGHGASGRSA